MYVIFAKTMMNKILLGIDGFDPKIFSVKKDIKGASTKKCIQIQT